MIVFYKLYGDNSREYASTNKAEADENHPKPSGLYLASSLTHLRFRLIKWADSMAALSPNPQWPVPLCFAAT